MLKEYLEEHGLLIIWPLVIHIIKVMEYNFQQVIGIIIIIGIHY